MKPASISFPASPLHEGFNGKESIAVALHALMYAKDQLNTAS